MLPVLKELEKLRDRMKTIEEGLMLLQESTSKLLKLGKDTRNDVSRVSMAIDRLKQEGVKLLFKVFLHVESLKTKVNSSNNDLLYLSRTSIPPSLRMSRNPKNDSVITCTIPLRIFLRIQKGTLSLFWVVR